MTFTESVRICLTKKYFTMKGRASQSEYWWFQLFYFLCIIIACTFAGISGEAAGIALCIVLVILFIPNLCVMVRRLHDTGHSGAIILMYMIGSSIPIVNIIVLIFGSVC